MKFKIGQVEIEVSNEDVSKAIETGELELKSDKLIEKTEDTVIYSKSDFDTYTENIKKEEYKATKQKAEEMAMKAVKNEFGFEIEGYKDVKTFVSSVKEKIIEDAKIKPDQKIQTLENDLAQVRENLKAKETEFTTFKESVVQKETRAKKDAILAGLIPKEGLKVSTDITLLALKNKGLDVNLTDDGKTEFVFNGEVIKNASTLEPTDGKDFVLNKLTELELFTKPNGGAGGGDETGGSQAGSYEAFVKEMKSQDIDEGTSEFNVEMNKRISDKTLVM
jgi:hypothetical protein